MKSITVFYTDGEKQVYEGTVQFLSCGVMEITQQTEQVPSVIASLAQSKVIGIPLRLISRYEIV